jgi:hypothetical protein
VGVGDLICSLENPYSNNHHIMRYGSKDGLLALAFVLPRAQSGAKSSLDHRVDGLHLPSLPVFAFHPAEALFHQSPPPTRRRLGCRAASLRRDDCSDAVGPNTAVDPLGIEVRVGQQRRNPRATNGLTERLTKLHQVRAWTATRNRRQDHMTGTIDHEDDLGVLGVSNMLITGSALRATLDVVPTGVPRFQARTVDSRQRHTPLADPVAERPLEHSVEHPAARESRQETRSGLLEGREVWYLFHPDLTSQIAVVAEMNSQAAVIEAQELLEYQAGEQLGLRELLRAKLMPVRGKSLRGRIVRDLKNPAWGFACRHTL